MSRNWCHECQIWWYLPPLLEVRTARGLGGLVLFYDRQAGQNGSVFLNFVDITRMHIEAVTPSLQLKRCRNLLALQTKAFGCLAYDDSYCLGVLTRINAGSVSHVNLF